MSVSPRSERLPFLPHYSVLLAILVTIVRTMWMSVPPSPASMEAPVLISWPAISVPVPLAHLVCQGQGWGQAKKLSPHSTDHSPIP